MTKLRVCARKCDQCLYTKERIVRKARATEIIQGVARDDSYFNCHKAQLRGEKEELVCRGSFEQHPSNLIRIAGRMNYIEFVDPDTGEIDDSVSQ